MRTEKLRAFVPFLLMDGVLVLAMLMLWQLDWVVHNNENLPVGAVVVVPEKFQGFASMYSRLDLKIRVAPALLSLDAVVRRGESEGNIVYAVYYLNEVGGPENMIEILTTFRNVGIYRVYL